MLRFKPDSFLEGLMRPFIMVDPVAGVYFEDMAPDVRFAALALLLGLIAVGWVASKRAKGESAKVEAHSAPLPPLHAGQWRGLAALGVMFFAWTFAIGNGRYFIAGLLLVGPLVALACSRMPGTKALRTTTLLGVLALQLFVFLQAYAPNRWGLARWTQGEALAIEASPLRQSPGVFLTFGSISFSILTPKFHPQSRWSNISGQRDIQPGILEYSKLQDLLRVDLPKYAVMPVNEDQRLPSGQPSPNVRTVLNGGLAPHRFRLSDVACTVLASSLATSISDEQGKDKPYRGFWFCPVVPSAVAAGPQAAAANPWDEVFAQLERRCPRFFPPGDSKLRQFTGIAARYYTSSDTRVYVDGEGQVLYRYFRAFNPTYVGTTEQVLRGEFELNCQKLPGRYLPPWQRD